MRGAETRVVKARGVGVSRGEVLARVREDAVEQAILSLRAQRAREVLRVVRHVVRGFRQLRGEQLFAKQRRVRGRGDSGKRRTGFGAGDEEGGDAERRGDAKSAHGGEKRGGGGSGVQRSGAFRSVRDCEDVSLEDTAPEAEATLIDSPRLERKIDRSLFRVVVIFVATPFAR